MTEEERLMIKPGQIVSFHEWVCMWHDELYIPDYGRSNCTVLYNIRDCSTGCTGTELYLMKYHVDSMELMG